MNQPATPLTDAYLKEMQWPRRINVAGTLNFARRLERYRAALIAALEECLTGVTGEVFDNARAVLSQVQA